MIRSIVIIALSHAIALTAASALAGRDGAELRYQAQTLQRIKAAGNVESRSEPQRIPLAGWGSRHLPGQS